MSASKIMTAAALGAFFLSACVADEHDVRITGLSASQNLERILLNAKKFEQKRACSTASSARTARVDTGRGRGISQRHAVNSRPAIALGTSLEPLNGLLRMRKAYC